MTAYLDYINSNPIPNGMTPASAPGFSSLDTLGTSMQNALPDLNSAVSGAGKSIANAFTGGVNQVKQGYQQAETALSNPNPISQVGGLLGGVGAMGSGVVSAAMSPLAPATQPIGQAAGAVGNAISNSPTVQKFATSPAGQDVATGAQNVANYANFAGGIAGGMAGADTVQNIWEQAHAPDAPVTPSTSPSAPSSSNDTLQSRINDATPAYNKNLIGTKVKTAEGQIVPRVNAEGGIATGRNVVSSAADTAAGTELNKIPDYDDRTALTKYLSTDKAVGQEAENMRGGLQAEDKENPLNTESQKAKVSGMVQSHLPADVQSRLGILTPEDKTYVSNMQKSLGAPMPKGGFDLNLPGEGSLPKTPQFTFYRNVMDSINNFDGSREGLLDLRQNIDSAYEKAAGKMAWKSDSLNELDQTNKDIRDDLNKELAQNTENTDVKSSLQKQTNLYHARDILIDKAQTEAQTGWGRLEQKYPSLRMAVRRIGWPLAIGLTTGGSIYTLAKALRSDVSGTQ